MKAQVGVKALALKLLAGSSLPARWFYPSPPPAAQRASATGMLSIEIVSHCWQYSRLLAYQLTSLIRYPVHDASITVTVFYAAEDKATVALLQFIETHTVNNVTWNWQCLPKAQLFRRAIGRNRAALASTADWLWFTDCDMTFQAGCLDGLNAALQGSTQTLVYPRIEGKTDVYGKDDTVLANAIDTPALLDVDASDFVPWPVTRATGPLQITHGDVARAVGYCNAVDYYQQPSDHWEKAVEDRMFRYLLGTPGEPLDVPGVCRIQHAQKGRYREDTASAALRRKVRTVQHHRRTRQRND